MILCDYMIISDPESGSVKPIGGPRCNRQALHYYRHHFKYGSENLARCGKHVIYARDGVFTEVSENQYVVNEVIDD